MRLLLPLSAALCIAAYPASAQEWNTQQREVIDHVRQCWEAWNRGWDAWTRACPHGEDRVFWATEETVPKTEWSNFPESIEHFMSSEQTVFFEHRPLYVGLHGDVATYAYWVTYSVRDANDQNVTRTEKRMETFQRVGGRWFFVAGMAVQEKN